MLTNKDKKWVTEQDKLMEGRIITNSNHQFERLVMMFDEINDTFKIIQVDVQEMKSDIIVIKKRLDSIETIQRIQSTTVADHEFRMYRLEHST